MNENKEKLLSDLKFERQKSVYLEIKLEEKEKEIQIIASILIVTLITLFLFMYAHYEYEMERIYQSAVSMVIGGVIFYFSYKKYPRIASVVFCSFFMLAAYKKGGFIDWSLGTFFAILFISNFFKKNDAAI